MTDAEKVQELLWALADIHDEVCDRVDYDVDGANYAARIVERIARVEQAIGRPHVAVEVISVPGVSA